MLKPSTARAEEPNISNNRTDLNRGPFLVYLQMIPPGGTSSATGCRVAKFPHKHFGLLQKFAVQRKGEKVSVYNISNLLYIISLGRLSDDCTIANRRIALRVIGIIYRKKQ